MSIHKCGLVTLLAVLMSSATFAGTWFTNGYGRFQPVPNQAELIARLNIEAQAIANALLEADAMQETKVSAFLSAGNGNGFETKFECEEPQHVLLIAENSWRAAKVHRALIDRYEELIRAALAVDQIKDSQVFPLKQYIERIRRHEG